MAYTIELLSNVPEFFAECLLVDVQESNEHGDDDRTDDDTEQPKQCDASKNSEEYEDLVYIQQLPDHVGSQDIIDSSNDADTNRKEN